MAKFIVDISPKVTTHVSFDVNADFARGLVIPDDAVGKWLLSLAGSREFENRLVRLSPD